MPNQKIQFIIDNLQENLEVEAKNWLNGLSENADKATLAKEIIALANSGGSYVFIGFDDVDGTLTETEPELGQFEAFTQDAVAGIIQRYITPPCQCRVANYSMTGSDIQHPVIEVPGSHRTPLFAARGAPDGELDNGKVYVRRPGGNSEQARNQDDWEKLIERLVKARQSEMLGAFREIVNPSEAVIPEVNNDFEDWQERNLQAWKDITEQFAADDPRRLSAGFWTVSFAIDTFETETLNALRDVIDRQMPKHSGWPPFTYLHRDPVQPRAHGDTITAYIGSVRENEQPEERADHADYWSISRSGQGFLLRPMQEDCPGYPGEIYPMPEGPFFDWVFPIYRMTEVFRYIQTLSQHFSEDDATFRVHLKYYNTAGRRLETGTRNFILNDGAVCAVDELESSIAASVAEIETNLEEILFSLLAPIYEQFEFTELPRQLVTNVVADALSNHF